MTACATMPTVTRAVRRVKGGASFLEVAQELGVHHATVRRWCHARGVLSQFPQGRTDVRSYRYSAATVARVRASVRAGESMCRVSRRERIPLSTLQTWCASVGIRSRYTYPQKVSA